MKEFSYENASQEIPKFWGEISQKYLMPLMMGKKPESEIEKAICNCGSIGEFGINIDDIGNGKFRYIIAGRYTGGEVPEGMVTYELPDVQWAKFSCRGPMPQTLQTLNTKLFKEWLPGNPDYKVDMRIIVEWYSKGDTTSMDYESGLWIPVSKK